MTQLLHTRAELDAWIAQHQAPRGVVLTMGALHEGHLALAAAAREAVGPRGSVMVTIFVNPTQFIAGEDFAKYPRTLEEDVARCERAGVDAVFAPDVDTVYPTDEPTLTYDPGPLAKELEGAVRPGHFAGVMQVVSRLLQLTHADVAPFGEKDFQQLVTIRRLIAVEPALSHVRIVAVPTVRDTDGLALSSRNRYLSPVEREQAVAIPVAITAAQSACAHGGDASAAIAAARAVLDAAAVDVDYIDIRSTDLGLAPESGEARVLVAARVGATRLLDNAPVTLQATA